MLSHVWCLILCHPMDYSSPSSSVHEILLVRILERVAISFSRGLPNLVIELMPLASPTLAGGFFTTMLPGKPLILNWLLFWTCWAALRICGILFCFWYRKIYYYRAFLIKIIDLGLSFLPLYKAKRETLATLTTLKRTSGMSPTALPLPPNPATRTSSFSSIKFKQPSLDTKAVIFFCHSWFAEPWHTSWWQNLAVWLQLLLFPAQFPWREKHRRKGWPSGLCPDGLSCTAYHATSGLVGGYGASWQYKDRDTCPSCRDTCPRAWAKDENLWDLIFPNQGSNLGPQEWEHQVLTTGPPGNSQFCHIWFQQIDKEGIRTSLERVEMTFLS